MSHTEVLVGTDGSATADRAVASASHVAAALSVPLVLVTAWQRHPDDPPPPSEEASYPAGGTAAGVEAQWATTTTTDAAAIARSLGVTEVRQVQPIGRAAEALLRVAADHPTGLLTVGTYGLADRTERLVGNVPHALTHHASVDLLLTTGRDEGDWRTVALATDGSGTAARAVRRGLELTTALGIRPTLLTAAPDEASGKQTLDDVVAGIPAAADAERRVAVGRDAASVLSETAADLDLLVLGNKGMSGPSRLLGSVANRVTHEVPTNLLLVNTTR